MLHVLISISSIGKMVDCNNVKVRHIASVYKSCSRGLCGGGGGRGMNDVMIILPLDVSPWRQSGGGGEKPSQ